MNKEQIKRASKIAVKGYHVPATWSKETWEHNMLMCIKAELFVPNAIQNAAQIKEDNKLADRPAKKARGK